MNIGIKGGGYVGPHTGLRLAKLNEDWDTSINKFKIIKMLKNIEIKGYDNFENDYLNPLIQQQEKYMKYIIKNYSLDPDAIKSLKIHYNNELNSVLS